MGIEDAIKLAIEALNEAAEKHHFEARMDGILGERLPAEARRGVERRERLLEAMEVLQTLTPALSQGARGKGPHPGPLP